MRAVTHWRETVSALPSAPAITMPPTPGEKAAIASNVRVRALQSVMLRGDTNARLCPLVSWIATRRCGSAKGNGRSSVASTRAKIALLAPMPRARVVTAMAVNAGAWRNCRNANPTSDRRSSSQVVIFISRSLLRLSSTNSRFTLRMSPIRFRACSRAALGSCPRATSSRVRSSR